MKILPISILLLTTVATLPAEDPRLTSLMKGMHVSFGALQQDGSMSAQKAVRSAERLGTDYEDLIEYWRQRNLEHAVAIAEAGKTAAVQLANALHSGNAAQAATLKKALGDTCRSCHDAYREKTPDGGYRIKPD